MQLPSDFDASKYQYYDWNVCINKPLCMVHFEFIIGLLGPVKMDKLRCKSE